MNILKNHDILKNISLFINYKHIWYLSVFNKNILYDDDYWNYRAKNIYECDKINNKQEYESYYETLFEDRSNIKLYNIKPLSLKMYVVYVTLDDYYFYIQDRFPNNILVHEKIEKIINNINSEKFKNKNNFNEKIKYMDSIYLHVDNKIYIRIERNDVEFPLKFNKGNICNVEFVFNNIKIEKKENGYEYSLNMSRDDSYISLSKFANPTTTTN